MSRTYVGEENSGDTSARVQPLGVAIRRIIATSKAALVAGDRVLVSLDTAVMSLAKVTNVCAMGLNEPPKALFPSQRQVASGHNLDKVHVYVRVVSIAK